VEAPALRYSGAVSPPDPDRHCVATFDEAEALIADGIESARVAVAADPATVTWEDGRYVPAAPWQPPRKSLVVLPTYDEAENLRPMVEALGVYAAADILVADDNSPDGTGAIADELAAAHGHVHVLHRPGKEGLGPAYLAGFAWALERGYERVLEVDCDFSHAPWDVPRLIHAAETADLVIGSRYVRGGSTDGWPLSRRLLSRGGNVYTSVFLGRKVRDWTAGFRCFRADILRKLDFSGVGANGYAFQIAMAWNVLRAGGTIREIPVRFVDRARGKSKMNWSIALEAIRLVPKLRWKG
jgi:dolichol-phosphate mannosyltransferase